MSDSTIYLTFKPTSRSLGTLAAFVSQYQPFTDYEFGPVMKSLIYQLDNGTHAVAMNIDPVTGKPSQLAAYVGWIKTTSQVAETWLNNDGPLSMTPDEYDAVAVTILAAQDKRRMLGLIKHAKTLNQGKSVYWKRYFQDGRDPSNRSVVKKTDPAP